jgi:DNA-binding transcriptional LysR family regulator
LTLGVAQPTVGRRIAALEQKLGAKMFAHLPTGRELSATGEQMLAHAERIEHEVLSVERVAAGRDVGLRGRVTITASEWLIGAVLGPALLPFSERHSELELELLADTRNLSLARRDADIALRPTRFEQQEVIQRKVATLGFGFVGMTCLPRFVGDATPGLRLLRTPSPGPERELFLGAHREARTTPRVRASIAFLTSAIERLKPALCPSPLG